MEDTIIVHFLNLDVSCFELILNAPCKGSPVILVDIRYQGKLLHVVYDNLVAPFKPVESVGRRTGWSLAIPGDDDMAGTDMCSKWEQIEGFFQDTIEHLLNEKGMKSPPIKQHILQPQTREGKFLPYPPNVKFVLPTSADTRLATEIHVKARLIPRFSTVNLTAHWEYIVISHIHAVLSSSVTDIEFVSVFIRPIRDFSFLSSSRI